MSRKDTRNDGLATGILWIVGSSFAFLAALGVLRMPDVFTRMQASTKASTLGLGCLLIGAALQFGDLASIIRIVSIGAFTLADDAGLGARHCPGVIPRGHTAMGRHGARRAPARLGSCQSKRTAARRRHHRPRVIPLCARELILMACPVGELRGREEEGPARAHSDEPVSSNRDPPRTAVGVVGDCRKCPAATADRRSLSCTGRGSARKDPGEECGVCVRAGRGTRARRRGAISSGLPDEFSQHEFGEVSPTVKEGTGDPRFRCVESIDGSRFMLAAGLAVSAC